MAEPFYGPGAPQAPGMPPIDPAAAAERKRKIMELMSAGKNLATVPFGGAPSAGPGPGPVAGPGQVYADVKPDPTLMGQMDALTQGPSGPESNVATPPLPPHDEGSAPNRGDFIGRAGGITEQPGSRASLIKMPDGRTVMTNQQADYMGQGGIEGSWQVEQEGTTIRHPDSQYMGSATTRGPGMGGFSPSQTDWTKVANPQGFEAFREEPTENILAKRAAELSKNKALIEDPWAQERVEGQVKEGIASAPQRAIQAGDQQRRQQQQAEYDQVTPEWAEQELAKDPIYGQLPPEIREKAKKNKMAQKIEEIDKRYGKLTSRQDIFTGGVF